MMTLQVLLVGGLAVSFVMGMALMAALNKWIQEWEDEEDK